MSVEIEGLEFQIEANSEQASSGVDALTKSFKRLQSTLKSFSGLESASKELGKLNETLSKLQDFGKLEGLSNAVNALGQCRVSSTLGANIEKIGDAIHKIQQEDIDRLERLSAVLQDISSVGPIKIPNLKGLNNNSASGSNVTSGVNDTPIDSGVSEANGYMNTVYEAANATNIFKSVLNSVGGVFSKVFSIGNGTFKDLKTGISGVIGVAKKLLSPITALGKQIGSKLGAQVKNVTSKFKSLFSSIKRIAMYRLIRSFFSALTNAMKEGISNLYQYSKALGGTFAGSMDSVATSFQYLKNSMAAMVSPLVNSLAPAIDYITEKLVALFNIINQLLARLTGSSTYTAAKKVATTYADAADTATGAADELKKTILGFDEINALNDDSSSGSGSGSDSTDYSSMFEEVDISSDISDFVDRLMEAFEAGDWEAVGTIIGDKINECIDSIDWSGIGDKIGYWINAAIQMAYYTLDTIDFSNLFSHLAELLNSALEQIDFSFIGRLIVKPFTILGDLVVTAITDVDWGLVASSLVDLLVGALNEITDWFNGVDWKSVGSALYQDLKDVIQDVDWGELASSIFTFLGTAIGSAAQFLGGFFGDIGADIKQWWDEEIAGENWLETAGNLLSAIGEGFSDIKEWVYENIIDPFMTALTGNEEWENTGWGIGYKILQGLLSFFTIGSITDSVADAVKEAVENYEDDECTIGVGVKLFKSDFWDSDAWTAIKTTGETVVKTVQAKVEKAATWVADAWTAAKMTAQTVVRTVQSKLQKASTWVADAWTAAKMTASSVTRIVNSKVQKALTWISDAWTAAKMTASSITRTVKSKVQKGSTWISDAWTAAKMVGGTIYKTVSVTLSWASNNISTLKSWLGLASGGVVTSVGVKAFAEGGIVGTDKWFNSVPKYASGTNSAHGTMFVAGEAGPEIVGHVGGRTEVLNKSQLASTMYAAITDGLSNFTGCWDAISQTIALCASAIIQEMPDVSSITVPSTSSSASSVNGWLGGSSESITDEDVTSEISAGIKEGMYEANARQNELLRQQNDLLRQLLDKDTTVEITTNSFTKAMNRRNQRDGKTIIPVGT